MRTFYGGPGRHAARLTAVGLTAGVLVGVLSASGAVAATAKAPAGRSTVAPATDAYAFSTPTAMAAYGGALFVVNSGGNSVTELNASTGAWIRTISGAAGRFSSPTAIANYTVDLFVANRAGSLSELDARTGRLLRVIAGSQYRFSSPTALAAYGGYLWILNAGGSVTQIVARTGAWVRTIAGGAYGFNRPTAIVVAGGQAWVTDTHGNALTEFDATTGAWVRTVISSAYQLRSPSGITFDGTRLWVANYAASSMTVIVAATGALSQVVSASSSGPEAVAAGDARVYVTSPDGYYPMLTAYLASSAAYQWMMCNSNGPYNFNNPAAALVVGTVLWVTNAAGNSLTEMDASSGALLRTVV